MVPVRDMVSGRCLSGQSWYHPIILLVLVTHGVIVFRVVAKVRLAIAAIVGIAAWVQVLRCGSAVLFWVSASR